MRYHRASRIIASCAFALSAFGFLAGCAGTPDTQERTPSRTRKAEPLPGDADFSALVQSDPARAFVIAFREYENGAQALRATSSDGMAAAAGKMLETIQGLGTGGNPSSALAAYDSLKRISLHEGVKGLLPSGWDTGVSRATIIEAIAAEAESKKQALAARIIREEPAPAKADAAKRGDFPSMISGVCTIIVDRGLKMENNVAVPDRVIGTGFFIDHDGHLLTNYHVIDSEVDPAYEGYSRLYVRMPGDKYERVPAKVVGWDRSLDLALVKVSIKPEYVFELGRGREFKVGDGIYAIGSPVGLESTVTSGIVSAIDRAIIPLGDAIQVDVPVNPGNSGGPLIDEDGRLAGVVFAGLPQFQGLSFALPMRWVRTALPGLYAGGEVKHSFLGACASGESGNILVDYAIPGSGASESGIEPRERILSVNGVAFKTPEEFRAYTMTLPKGSLALVETESGGEIHRRFADLRARPYLPLEPHVSKADKDVLFSPLFGMDVERTGRGPFSRSYRIVSIRKGGVADEAGLSPEDPFVLHGWQYEPKLRYVIIQLYVKRQKKGFLESIMQLPAPIAAPVIF